MRNHWLNCLNCRGKQSRTHLLILYTTPWCTRHGIHASRWGRYAWASWPDRWIFNWVWDGSDQHWLWIFHQRDRWILCPCHRISIGGCLSRRKRVTCSRVCRMGTCVADGASIFHLGPYLCRARACTMKIWHRMLLDLQESSFKRLQFILKYYCTYMAILNK